ncbi:hypothetical protein BJ170DRAFT_20391 [Xylariales sp. AK1849]|nr:hypothetical protein BJ170DRAFT_20391 [Xylariales sp. AK1849]
MSRSLFKTTSSAGRPKSGPSNIRGKISGPIPIPDPAEDDEFPMRQPGTGLATPVGNEGRSKLHLPPDGSSTLEVNSTSGPSDVAPEERTESVARTGPSQASETSGNPAQRRTNRSSTLRYSTMSTGTDTDQSPTAPRRKKSTLRTTLGRLFGRKKKGRSVDSGLKPHVEDPVSSVQHRSDPSALGRVLTKEGEPKRSASLPITEFDRALRSHSVGPDDIFAIESARNSLNGEPIRYRRRAATTSSKLYATRSKDFGDLAGLSPRPASTHGRGTLDDLGGEDPNNIGRAITSDILMQQHRRSRSLSQLKDITEVHQRKRSDEIRYWRQSYDPGFQSPASSNVNDDTGNVTIDMPEAPVEIKPKTPPQPFNFSTMKITQAASLEERIASLEGRNDKLEKLVAQLFQVVPGVNSYQTTPDRDPHPVPSAPSFAYTSTPTAANPALYRTTTNETQASSRYGSSRHSNESFGDGHTFIDSIPPSTKPLNRPTSTATVRGATSLPTFPRGVSETFNADHYTTLLALLETERAARQVLEAQVTKLSNKLNLMSRTSQKLEALTGPTNATSVFEHDEDDTQDTAGDDDYSDEAFKTPREEHAGFDEDVRDEEADVSRRKASRTMSLGELTLGKPPKSTAEVGVNL